MASNVELKRERNFEATLDESVDPYTNRPRTPNVLYSNMTAEQEASIKKSSHAFFHHEKEEPKESGAVPEPREGGRHYIDRYATSFSQYLLSDEVPLSHPYCYVGEKFDHQVPKDHNASRYGAYFSWGPNRAGERTASHFEGESPVAFLPVDTYHRPPTNQPGQITFKYGRPSDGYYSQRNPQSTTWFGSAHRLNEHGILQDIRPKTLAEYEELRNSKVAENTARRDAEQWPEYSEYTAKYEVMEPTSREPESALQE